MSPLNATKVSDALEELFWLLGVSRNVSRTYRICVFNNLPYSVCSLVSSTGGLISMRND